MKFKVVTVVFGVFVILSLIYWAFYSLQREGFSEDVNQQWYQSLKLIEQGDYEQGFELCKTFSSKYEPTVVCHAVALGIKLSHNETITSDFCESFPIKYESNWPWALRIFRFFESPDAAKRFEDSAIEQKQLCLSYVS